MAEHRKITNPLALAVLGLLVERPMHPYEMAATLRERHKDGSFKLRTGTLYDVVEAVQREGWIEATGSSRDGRRPERTIYRQTDRGHAAFVEWLDELVRIPTKEFPRFVSGVSYLGALGPERAKQALQERIHRLEEEIAATREALLSTQALNMPRLFNIEVEYVACIREAELEWVRRIVHDIESGELPWPGEAAPSVTA